MPETEKTPSKRMKEFLDFIRESHARYQPGYDTVNREDKRLQDFAHEIEFAQDEEALYSVAKEFQASRRERRRNKDKVKMYELIVKFFGEKNPRDTPNWLEQLPGQQRREDEYLASDRVYKPRVK